MRVQDILASSHRTAEHLVRRGEFRSDLRVGRLGRRHEITKGTAVVKIDGATFHADLHGTNGVEYSVSGTIDKTNVKATFSVLGSDYFVDSPFSGTFQTKRWAGIAGSKGRESFALSDGWNYVGLTE